MALLSSNGSSMKKGDDYNLIILYENSICICQVPKPHWIIWDKIFNFTCRFKKNWIIYWIYYIEVQHLLPRYRLVLLSTSCPIIPKNIWKCLASKPKYSILKHILWSLRGWMNKWIFSGCWIKSEYGDKVLENYIELPAVLWH